REDERIFGRYDFIKDIKKSVDIAFRYLPREFFVEISGEKNGSRKLIERSGIIEAPILKMIIVDRDKEVVENEKIRQQQTCYLIEGDEFNHFGYISAWSLVSTGKEHNDQHPGGYTALGYYYVQRKKKFSFNERYNWEMPFALWYEKESGMSEGQNGIHEYHNTPFGREASHGCVREPAEFARANFNWADLKTRVIIIGKRNKNEEDENRFDTNDYPTFRALIDDAMNYRDRIRASDYSSSSFSERQRQDLSKISEIMKKMREQPFSSIEKFSGGERFGKYVKEFVSNKDF
ncbi:MAG: L,D-transpeptidase, partial [Candidatus Pacearchaeota archaeon]